MTSRHRVFIQKECKIANNAFKNANNAFKNANNAFKNDIKTQRKYLKIKLQKGPLKNDVIPHKRHSQMMLHYIVLF
jgi:hypothetical protein